MALEALVVFTDTRVLLAVSLFSWWKEIFSNNHRHVTDFIHHKLVPNDLKIPPLSLLAEIGFIFSYSPISATYVSVTRRQGLS